MVSCPKCDAAIDVEEDELDEGLKRLGDAVAQACSIR